MSDIQTIIVGPVKHDSWMVVPLWFQTRCNAK